MTDDTPRSITGIPGLDQVLHGGFLPHRMYLLDGNPGAGKTTLAMQYLIEGVKAGERCLYVTLSETREELEIGARSHGWSLAGIDIVELVADEESLDHEAQLTMIHPSEVDLTETTRKVLDAIERINPQRMVFDSLSEMRLLAQSSLRYRRQILALKQFFKGRRCTVILLDDRTAEGPDMQLHSIAHGVISLDQATPSYGAVRRQLQVLKFRGSDFVSGFHDFAIRSGGLMVFPRLVASEHGEPFKRALITSGVQALDDLAGGGVERGTSTLLIGPPGSGKSTITLQYAAAAVARGDHAAVFMFDERKAALLARLEGIGLHVKEGNGPGELMLRQVDPVEIAPGEFTSIIRESVERDNAKVVVIDSLNGYMNPMPQGNYLTAQLHELLSYLNNQGVATFLVVAQSGMMGGNMRAPVDASYLADSVIMLRYFEHEGGVKKAISVLKRRTGSHEESIRQLWFDAEGIHLSEPLLSLRGVLTGLPEDLGSIKSAVLDAVQHGV
ncbi:MAG: ATPase domain-containing protein [Pseudomonadota bacterium]